MVYRLLKYVILPIFKAAVDFVPSSKSTLGRELKCLITDDKCAMS